MCHINATVDLLKDFFRHGQFRHGSVLGLRVQVLVARGGEMTYRGGFPDKLSESSLISDRANTSRLQDGPATGHGQANSNSGSASRS